ncbi:MAG: ClC family H(+)/Cl(-) exchange transporter [Clostridiales bacterium]|nr:ClC family H(+)/Cl(-) exchange transporter [Clostridiales bacterium]
MKNKEKTTLRKIEYSRKESVYLIVRGLQAGVAAGIASVLYRLLIVKAQDIMLKINEYTGANPRWLALWFLALAAMGALTAFIVKKEPLSSGSGIPQIKGELSAKISAKWHTVTAAKFAGGALAALGGLSLGREGPSIQLGGMAGKAVANITGADKTTQLRMISCGAGAGLAASFNAPLAGIMFVLEEIQHTFDKAILCMGLVAAVTADFISKIIFGQSTVFSYETADIPLRFYPVIIVLGLLLGLLGAGYNVSMSFFQDIFARIKLPAAVKTAGVYIISGAVALVLPQVLGSGQSMVEYLMQERPSVGVVLILLFAKFLFSAVSFSSGAPGGIFYPLLILGTYVGAAYGETAINLFSLDENLLGEFIVISMAGLFSSIVRAPITGVVLIAEMTGNINSLLPLAVVSLASYATANITGVKPVYTMLLEKIVKGSPPAENSPGEKVIKTFAVPIGSPVAGKTVADVDWGRHCLIVSIDRDSLSITPKGDTVIETGDELVIMISRRRLARDMERLKRIIGS